MDFLELLDKIYENHNFNRLVVDEVSSQEYTSHSYNSDTSHRIVIGALYFSKCIHLPKFDGNNNI